MKNLDRKVTLLCPLCGNDQFESLDEEFEDLLHASDNDIKTQVEINGVQRRIYMGNEFDSVGISVDGQLCCVDRNSCGPDKIRIIDGTSDKRVFCIQGDRKTNLALPKMEFADRVLGNSPEYSNIDFSSFSLIFDIINKICDQ